MSSRDWFRERVDLGLLADDLPKPEDADATTSPFESTFTDQHGALTADQSKAQTMAFQRFCDVGEEGDTLIFFTHTDRFTEKIPRTGAIAAKERADQAKADAAKAQAEEKRKAEEQSKKEEVKEDEKKEEGSDESPPDAAADEAKLADAAAAASTATTTAAAAAPATDSINSEQLLLGKEKEEGDSKTLKASFLAFGEADDNDLYDIVTKERFRYRCIMASELEDMVLKGAAKQSSMQVVDVDDVDPLAEPTESADDIMSSMRSGVVYFVRKSSGSLSSMKTAKQLGVLDSALESGSTMLRDLSMSSCVEWGCLRGLSARNLTHLNSCIHSVFLPFLDGMMSTKKNLSGSSGEEPVVSSGSGGGGSGSAGKSSGSAGKSRSGTASGDSKAAAADGSAEQSSSVGFWRHAGEFRSHMSKFKGQLDSAIQQTRGRVSLPMRLDIILEEDKIDQAAADFETFRALEEMLGEWTEVVKDVVAQQQRAEPTGRGPMAEIEFWRHQHGVLSALYEQLSSERALMVVHVLKIAGSTLLDDYQNNHSELTRLHVEAADNTKFLATLERHFKNIESGTSDLRLIEETLESMMNGLRMVWIISRHYNTDERMVRLMERIADSIAESVTSKIDASTILRASSTSGNRALIVQARNVLDKWRASYFETRAQIEIATPQHRWEFHTEKKTLFERTDYISSVCQDLIHVVDVVTQVRIFPLFLL